VKIDRSDVVQHLIERESLHGGRGDDADADLRRILAVPFRAPRCRAGSNDHLAALTRGNPDVHPAFGTEGGRPGTAWKSAEAIWHTAPNSDGPAGRALCDGFGRRGDAIRLFDIQTAGCERFIGYLPEW
jgi:hypothetical protein